MVFIIKKSEVCPDGVDRMRIVFQGAQAPCPVYEEPHLNPELKAYLLNTYGAGYYYVYLFGSNTNLTADDIM